MGDSHSFLAYLSCNPAHVIFLSSLTACMIDLHCCQVKIHDLSRCGLFPSDLQSVAQATKFSTVDPGHPVVRLIAAKEYLK